MNALPLCFSPTHTPAHKHTHTHTRSDPKTASPSVHWNLWWSKNSVTDYLLSEDLLYDSKGELFTKALGSILTVVKPF